MSNINAPSLSIPSTDLIMWDNMAVGFDWDGTLRESCDLAPFSQEQKDALEQIRLKTNNNAFGFTDNSALSARASETSLDLYAEAGIVSLKAGELLDKASINVDSKARNAFCQLPAFEMRVRKLTKEFGVNGFDSHTHRDEAQKEGLVFEGENLGKIASFGLNYGTIQMRETCHSIMQQAFADFPEMSDIFNITHSGTDCWKLKQDSAKKHLQLHRIMQRYTGQRFIMVGDTVSDQLTGLEAYKQYNGGSVAVTKNHPDCISIFRRFATKETLWDALMEDSYSPRSYPQFCNKIRVVSNTI